MIKKLTIAVLCFIMVFSLCAYAETAQEDSTASQAVPSENVPADIPEGGMGGRFGGGRGGGGMGTPPEGFDPSQMPSPSQGGAAGENVPTPPENGNSPSHSDTQDGDNTAPDAVAGDDTHMAPDGMGGMGGKGGGGRGGSFGGENTFTDGKAETADTVTEEVTEESAPQNAIEFIKFYQTPIISVVLLIFAFIFVKFYKRKNY